MVWLAENVRALVELAIAAFDGLGPFLSLTVLSCVTGALLLWMVGKTTPQARLERARSRVAASVYEMRLFIDSPRHVVKAQGYLFGWFFWYMALLLPAFLVLSIPLGLFLLHLETRHGLAALPLGEPIVMRVDLASSGPDSVGYEVTAEPATPDDAVRVTAPPLYIEDEARVYFRIEVDRPGEHRLVIRAGDEAIEKRISADPHAISVAPERRSGWATWYQLGDEPPIPDNSPFTAVLLEQPDKAQSWLYTSMPWWMFWLILSTIVALALRRPMGVVL